MSGPRKPASPFRNFNFWPEIIRLVVLVHARFLLSLRTVEDLLAERGIDVCHETDRFAVMPHLQPLKAYKRRDKSSDGGFLASCSYVYKPCGGCQVVAAH